jgi:hypothetical protein
MKFPRHHFLYFLTPCAFALTGCGDSGPSGSEIVVREIPKAHREFKLVDTSRERFRYQTREQASAQNEAAQPGGGPQLVWDVPEGWEEKPAAMMRDINLGFGPNGEGECYVARLPGAGGGLAANVNRWRGQMGAPALTPEEVDALPKKPLFGQPATFVSVEGNFSPGMGSQETKENYRLLGLILSSDAGAVFVKMTGPRELVDANAEKFDQFTSSIDVSMN